MSQIRLADLKTGQQFVDPQTGLTYAVHASTDMRYYVLGPWELWAWRPGEPLREYRDPDYLVET